jgi:hypothetical protein
MKGFTVAIQRSLWTRKAGGDSPPANEQPPDVTGSLHKLAGGLGATTKRTTADDLRPIGERVHANRVKHS